MEATTGGAPILSLPTELTISIFRKAKLQTLLRCAQVCHRWHTVVRDTPELQYQIELEANGVQDNCPIGMNIIERLQLLRRKRTASRTGIGEEKSSVMTLPGSSPSAWAFNGNSIAYIDKTARMVHYRQLAADFLSAEDITWPLPDVGASPTLALDPDQDLLAIASLDTVIDFHVSILLRSLTGAVHPLSLTSGELRGVPFTNQSAVISQQGLCISGDFISVSVVSLTHSISNTATWNWKTGVLQKRVGGLQTNMILVTDGLSMIWNPKMFISEDRNAGGLAVHTVQKNSHLPWSLSGQGWDYALLMPSFLFDFPDVGRHEVQLSTSCQTHRQSSVFPPAPDADCLITLDIFEFNGLVGTRTRRLLISRAKLVEKLQARQDDSPRRVLVWDEWKACVVWASENTRKDALEPQRTTGMRYVEQVPPSADDSSSLFDILDFDPWRVARAMSTGVYPGESLVHTSCFISDELVVRHPYLVRQVKVDHDPRSWLSAHLISDEGLLVVSPNNSPVGIQDGALTVSVVPFAENIETLSSS